MGDVVNSVAGKISPECAVKSCVSGKCNIKLQGMPKPHIIVDMDCKHLNLNSKEKRCDFLFVGEQKEHSWIVVMEMKGGALHESEIFEQLQNGAQFATDCVPQGINTRFFPVLIYKKKPRMKYIRMALKKRKIKFRNRHGEYVIMILSGSSLKNELDALLL